MLLSTSFTIVSSSLEGFALEYSLRCKFNAATPSVKLGYGIVLSFG